MNEANQPSILSLDALQTAMADILHELCETPDYEQVETLKYQALHYIPAIAMNRVNAVV